MTKVGLKETLSLLAAGYKKKDIEAMIAAEEEEKDKETPAGDPKPADPAPESAPEDAAAKESTPEPDYKSMYEELLKKTQETEEKIKKIQQDNVHKDSAPAADEKAKAQTEALTNLVRSFM